MSPRHFVRFSQIAATLLATSVSVVKGETRLEHGRRVLEGVRAMHRMMDFGIEAIEPDEMDSLALVQRLFPKGENPTLADDEWGVRSALLHVEKLGRDLVAGRPVPDAAAKCLDEHFTLPIDPRWGLRMDKGEAKRADECYRAFRKMHERLAEKLATGKPLAEDERIMGYASFRSGDQLSWRIEGFSFDVPRMVKAYAAATPQSKHAIRMLFALRAKADEQAATLILNALKGESPIERYDAAMAIGQMRPTSEKLIAALTNCLSDSDPRVVRAAVRSLLALRAAQSAPAMLRRLQIATVDKDAAILDKRLGFAFEEHQIRDSRIGFRYDVPTELMFALGRFHYREALPLLWEIVQGKGEDLWQYEGIYQLGHGGVAVEAILEMGTENPAILARRVLTMGSATLDALGAAANVLGEHGGVGDVPVLLKLMTRVDAAARRTPEGRFHWERSMSRATFAAERLVFFADRADPKFAATEGSLVATLRNVASGPYGVPCIAALRDFDRDHVDATALALAADVRADPDARRAALKILGGSKDVGYVEQLINLFEDNANTNGSPVGLYAADAAARLLEQASSSDPRVAGLVRRVADRLERVDRGHGISAMELDRLLLRVDSDRGVRRCSRVALDASTPDFDRQTALDSIADFAKPNRDLAKPLRPLLEVSGTNSGNALRAAAIHAAARLLGLNYERKPEAYSTWPVTHVDPELAELVQRELKAAPHEGK